MLTAEGGRLWLAVGDRTIARDRGGGDRFIVKHPDFDLFALEFGRERNAVIEAWHGPRRFTHERYTVGPVLNGLAMRMKFSGVEFYRTFTL